MAKKASPRKTRPLDGGDPFLTLHVLIYPEGDLWMAHCLEFDAVAQGDSPERVREGLMDSVSALVEDARQHGRLAELFRPAPVGLWRRFAEAGRRNLHVNLAPPGASVLASACIEERLVPA
ncbi:MAG: hypothetical protein HY722_01500 [Planctomycetes bacterium]|nr:hypothetical protein [Planctomycetota bacterium]